MSCGRLAMWRRSKYRPFEKVIVSAIDAQSFAAQDIVTRVKPLLSLNSS